jgi:hypothetical protein
MPQIPEYTVTEGRQAAAAVRIQPSDLGIQTLSQGARNIGRLAGQEAEGFRRTGAELDRGLTSLGTGIEQHQSLQEVSSINSATAALHDSINKDYQAALANSATDPNALKNFNDSMEQKLSDFTSLGTTPAAQKHALEQEDTIRKHYTAAQMVDLPRMAGDKAVADVETAVNHYTAIGSEHPETLGTNITLFQQSMTALKQQHPELTSEQNARLDEEIRKGVGHMAYNTIAQVALGDPDRNQPPDTARARRLAKQFGDQLTPEEQEKIFQTTHVQDRAMQYDAERAQRLAKEQASAASQAQANDYLTKFTIDPATGSARPPANFMANVLGDKTLTEGDKRIMIEFGQRMDKSGDTQTANGLLNEFSQRMALPPGDPNRPSNAEILGHIGKDMSLQDGRFLLEQNKVHTPNDQLGKNQVATGYKMLDNFFNPAQALGGKRNGPNDVTNAELAHAWFNTAIQAGLNRGLTLLQLTSPGDPNYVLGKPGPDGIPENVKNIPGLIGNPNPGGAAAPPAPAASGYPWWNPYGWFKSSDAGSLTGGSQVAEIVTHAENGGRVHGGGPMTSAGEAQGGFQITTGTWKDFAARAGVDLKTYPTADDAPADVQHQVAKVIPLKRWDPRTVALVRAHFGHVDTSKTLGELEAELG